MNNPHNQNFIPCLLVNGAAEAIEFYKQALGATEIGRMETPDSSGKLMWSCIEIRGTKIFLSDTQEMCPQPTNSAFYVYFDDVEAAFSRAKAAGMTERMAPTDMFYGDRMGALTDRFGIQWSLAQHVRVVSDEEMREAVKQMGQAA